MRRRYAVLFMLSMIALIGSVSAETVLLPSEIKVIEAEAFSGCNAFTELVIPEGVETIGDDAFAQCSNLAQVTIPATVQQIGDGAFKGSEMPLLLRTTPGSTAMAYALANQLDFDADTSRRALLIGQCHYEQGSMLMGTLNDVQTMKTVLTDCADLPFAVNVQQDLTADQITGAIGDCFGDASPQDISLLYYSGHGASGSGSLVGVDGETVTAAELRACLDRIPGRKIVIVDACFSGALIGYSLEDVSQEEDFVNTFVSAFATKARSNLAADQYYVMTAASGSQSSVEIADGTKSYGVFTTSLAKGCGFDLLNGQVGTQYADANGDHIITFLEAFRYAKLEASEIYSKQTAQVWPSDCGGFGLIR